MFERLLPRHLTIIYEINRRFLRQVQIHSPDDDARMRRMSIIGEDGEPQVRMAHLAVVGSHHVNGVAKLTAGWYASSCCRTSRRCFPTASATSPTG
jgi:starch phosphorylase